ncbi:MULTISPECIES: phage baseplate assembly protein V [unclassified Streptomyces]|uniref:phage baseplate assembly protein V n=1 Tax=unclassified Streptomyces TaxID=2593676 RepID=UPI000BF7E540|nr:phage baseplate assembly protein V [Streptomyces sp. Ru87]PGH47018.1 baseplate assembly protein [Streptomyces sp. Ru87]
MAPAPNNRFLGKFRGRVADNNDPLRIGRITAVVPDVLGDEASTWAMPCFPFTGEQAGQYVMPTIGSGVWIEFEQGDPSFPIWTGCWFGEQSEMPVDAQAGAQANAQPVVIETQGHHKIVLSDDPEAGILLQAPSPDGTGTGPFVRINRSGVHFSNGQGASVSVAGDRVDVNEGRLIVPKKR